jgi:toxin YoeB
MGPPGKGRRKRPPDRECHLDKNFREDLEWWMQTDARVARKILSLMDAALRDPFDGIGKPEPLKHLGPNTWSRRLTQEHRVIYVVFEDRLVFVQARYHY